MKKKIISLIMLLISFTLLLSSCKIEPGDENPALPDEELGYEPPKQYDEIIMVESIELLNEDITINEKSDGRPYAIVRQDEQGVRQYQIKYRVHPENATTKGVVFLIDPSSKVAKVSETGLVTFSGKGMARVIIMPCDGSDISEVSLDLYSR